jgi:simple sugar transport system permease protein
VTTTAARPTSKLDERLAKTGPLRRILMRPELGSIVGAIIVFTVFASLSETFRDADGVATWLDPASTLGIMAVAVALLMIGGEFDLSAGVLTGTSGLVLAILSTEYGLNIWLAMGVSLVLCLLVGVINGVLVVRTKLPSFIITLGTFLMLQGLNLGITKAITNTVNVTGIATVSGFDSAEKVFAATFEIELVGAEFRIAIVWWVVITLLATWLLLRTRVGNWIFAVGGNQDAARSTGVPVVKTKVGLFMGTAFAAWFVGSVLALRLTSVQANTGIGQEFIFIIAAVIGGCLLTGGYGSAIGASIGALIFGMADKGIVYAGWDSDWFKFFLGIMLLAATLTNNFVKKLASEAKK